MKILLIYHIILIHSSEPHFLLIFFNQKYAMIVMVYNMYVYKGVNKSQFTAVGGEPFFCITAASACFIIVYSTRGVICNLTSHLSCKNTALEKLSDRLLFAGFIRLGI
jgi:hypothetical protein